MIKRKNRMLSVGDLAKGKNDMPTVIDSANATPQTLQYDLWSTFWGDEKSNLSNSVEFWDAIPKFSVHRNRQLELRDEYGRLGIYRKEFAFKGVAYEMEIQPAIIPLDEHDKAFYPSSDEELVWEVLVKIFSDQQYGIHIPEEEPPSSFVRFTLRMIQRELGKGGHKRSIPQIRHAVEVLSRSHLVISEKGKKPLYRNAILSDVVDITRDDYLEDPTKFWYARLPALISSALKTLDYRQFNQLKSLKFKDPLTRWLYKRITHRFTQASMVEQYKMLLSTIEEESGFFQETDAPARKVARVDKCIKELNKGLILGACEKDVRKAETRGRPIKDVLWILHPYPDFVREAKAANGRLKDAKKRLQLVSNRRRSNDRPSLNQYTPKNPTYEE